VSEAATPPKGEAQQSRAVESKGIRGARNPRVLVANERPVNPEAVDTLWTLAEGVLADERERGKTLDTKTASLAAFSGTILALDSTLGQGLLSRDLGSVGDPLLPVFFLLAAAALVVAAAVAVLGVLLPQRFLGINQSELARFAYFPLVGAEKAEIQGRMLRTVTEDVITVERERNDRKARLTKVSAVALGVGLVGIAGQAITLGLHERGI
jgi:hypothetical protein